MKVNFSYSINIKVQHTKTALKVLFFFSLRWGSHYVALAALKLTKIPLPMLGVGLPQALGLNV